MIDNGDDRVCWATLKLSWRLLNYGMKNEDMAQWKTHMEELETLICGHGLFLTVHFMQEIKDKIGHLVSELTL